MFYNVHGDTMKQVLLQLKCPHCFHVNLKVAETIVNPNIESDLKRQILNDEFFTLRCRCNTPIHFLYPCVYVDKKQHLILFMKEAEVLHDDRCIQRLVHDAEQFKEMIRIADAHLDDRAVFQIKRRLLSKNEKQLLYFLDCDGEYLWFTCEGQISGVAKADYDKLAAKLAPPTHEVIDVDLL